MRYNDPRIQPEVRFARVDIKLEEDEVGFLGRAEWEAAAGSRAAEGRPRKRRRTAKHQYMYCF